MRERHTKALIDGGFDDLNQALWNVIESFSGDDLHPSDLAARTNISKQAMNYLLGRLEMLGYVTRRAEKRRSSTLVFLTCRGQRAGKTLREAASLVEAEWLKILGQKRFNQFLDALGQLSSGDSRVCAGAAFQRRIRTTRMATLRSDTKGSLTGPRQGHQRSRP
jgi:DNA-binding MarR family transcriptional regulator